MNVKYLFFVFKNKFILMCILFDFRLILAEVLEFQSKKINMIKECRNEPGVNFNSPRVYILAGMLL